MKTHLYFIIFCSFFAPFAYGVHNADIPQIKSSYDSNQTFNYNFDLNGSQVGDGGAVEPCHQNSMTCYTGGIFNDYKTLTLNNNANITVNLKATGNYSGWAAVFFRGKGGDNYIINGGSFTLNLLSLPKPTTTQGNPVEGVFMTRRAHSENPVNFTFNTDIYVNATENFYITRGIFNVNDGKGGYTFNGNTYIDVSKMQESAGWQGSGVGYRSITSIGGDGYFYVNYNKKTKTTYRRDNTIQLKGDIAVEKSSSSTSEAIIHLTNPSSFLQGRFSLQGSANAELLLDRGGKWFLTANSAVSTLNGYNDADDIKNQYGNIEKVAVVDFTKIADDGINSRLTSDVEFKMRTLEIKKELKGVNGVFRLMADIPKGEVDKVSTVKLDGLQYIQVYQRGSRISFDIKNEMIVAHADSHENGNFVGLEAIAGIYNYYPTLTTKKTGNGGTDWILTKIDYTPNQTAFSLLNILSIPYKLYRLEAENIDFRINDLLYPPTNFGAWLKIYGGGIYQKNELAKKTFQNLFYSVQGGFDYGANIDNMRYFFGGSFDFLDLFGSDKGYHGRAKAYGFGFYGGYIYNDDFFVDAKIKYVLGHLSNYLVQAQAPFNFFTHLFFGSFRLGYSFYPFRNARTKTVQRCKRGGDGNLFCRNATSTGYIRDNRFYIQPFISIAPGVISNASSSFRDKTTNYLVRSSLTTAPALITKVGVLGVKRYDYDNFSVKANAQITYAYDINTGGKITLIDDAQIPLLIDNSKGQHHLGLGLGSEMLFLHDSLRIFADFKTEFFGRINTYWLFSGGLRYKFGQIIKRPKGRYSVRPKSPSKPRTKRQIFSPYNPALENNPQKRSFRNRNHFQEVNHGIIRPR